MYKMKRLEVSGEVRPLYGSLGVKGLKEDGKYAKKTSFDFTESYLEQLVASLTLATVAGVLVLVLVLVDRY